MEKRDLREEIIKALDILNVYYDKTPKRKEYKLMKQRTIRKYPIINQKCFKCGNPAEEHHHTTEPLEVDKFEYVCKDCHYKIHHSQ